jgi:hypothetical protein
VKSYKLICELPKKIIGAPCFVANNNWGAWLGIFGCSYVHASLQNKLSYTHSKMGSTYTCIFNHTGHVIGEDQSNLLFLTPSVGHISLDSESF